MRHTGKRAGREHRFRVLMISRARIWGELWWHRNSNVSSDLKNKKMRRMYMRSESRKLCRQTRGWIGFFLSRPAKST